MNNSTSAKSGENTGAKSNKDDHSPSKSKQPEEQPLLSAENLRLKKALEESSASVSHLESLWKERESQLIQAMQSKEDLQKKIAELNKQKQIFIADFNDHKRRADTIMKL